MILLAFISLGISIWNIHLQFKVMKYEEFIYEIHEVIEKYKSEREEE